MKFKKSIRKSLPLFLFSLSFLFLCTSCVDDLLPGAEYSDSDVMGKWVKSGTQEYWRYDSGHYGETWDEGEDVHEGEGTKFSWSLEGDDLEILLTGEMGQVVPYDYEIVALTGESMRLKDAFDNESTYYKQ